MTTPTNPLEPFSPFIASTYNIPTDPESFKYFLEENLANISDVVNDKMIGAFTQNVGSINGSKWSYDVTTKTRPGYQLLIRVISFVPQTIPMPITINPQFVITQTYGSANLPCTATGAGNGSYFTFNNENDTRIQYTLSDTQIIITTNGTTASYSGFIMINYILDGI
jgi:hypothetical protein